MSQDFDPYYEWLGIPPKDQPPNHYRLLGIELFEPNLNVIERAADRQMKHVRSFQSGGHSKASQQLLNQLSAARICLLNPNRRADYDQQLKQKLPVSYLPEFRRSDDDVPELPPGIPYADIPGADIPGIDIPSATIPGEAMASLVPNRSAMPARSASGGIAIDLQRHSTRGKRRAPQSPRLKLPWRAVIAIGLVGLLLVMLLLAMILNQIREA